MTEKIQLTKNEIDKAIINLAQAIRWNARSRREVEPF